MPSQLQTASLEDLLCPHAPLSREDDAAPSCVASSHVPFKAFLGPPELHAPRSADRKLPPLLSPLQDPLVDKTLLESREVARPKKVCFSESSLTSGDRTRRSYYLNGRQGGPGASGAASEAGVWGAPRSCGRPHGGAASDTGAAPGPEPGGRALGDLGDLRAPSEVGPPASPATPGRRRGRQGLRSQPGPRRPRRLLLAGPQAGHVLQPSAPARGVGPSRQGGSPRPGAGGGDKENDPGCKRGPSVFSSFSKGQRRT